MPRFSDSKEKIFRDFFLRFNLEVAVECRNGQNGQYLRRLILLLEESRGVYMTNFELCSLLLNDGAPSILRIHSDVEGV